MLDQATLPFGFDGLSLVDSSHVSFWLDHLIALVEGGSVVIEQATVHELTFRTILWRLEHVLPLEEERGFAASSGQIEWHDPRIRTALEPQIQARNSGCKLQECFHGLGALSEQSANESMLQAITGLAAKGIEVIPTLPEGNTNYENALFAVLLGNLLRGISGYLNRLSTSRQLDVVKWIDAELKRITPTETNAISGATLLSAPSAQALIDWLRAADDRLLAERICSTSGYALYLFSALVLRTIVRASLPPELIRASPSDQGRDCASDTAIFAALLVFSGACFWAPNQVLATAAARAVVVFGYGRQLAKELPLRAALSSGEDLALLRSISDLGSIFEVHEFERLLRLVHREYLTNPESTTVLGLCRLTTDGGPRAEAELLVGLRGLAKLRGSVGALDVVHQLVQHAERFAGVRIDCVLKAALVVWSELDVARLCYQRASEFGEMHHRALMVIITDLLASEGMENLVNG